MVFCEKIKFYKHQNQATMRKELGKFFIDVA